MPMSSSEGKAWTHDRIAALTAGGPISVLDIGPGVGTYAKLLHDLPVSRIVGLEAWGRTSPRTGWPSTTTRS